MMVAGAFALGLFLGWMAAQYHCAARLRDRDDDGR